MSKRERVVAAMSGGVDSAVAAALLVEAGYEVIGVTMRLYEQTRGERRAKSCCGVDDFDDARRSAAAIGIKHYVVDFEEAFRRDVVERFADEYLRGRTPNPCVLCNNHLKLGTLWRYARHLGASKVATGHYARLEQAADGPHLYRALDRHKDQAYALAQLDREQLASLMLPLGGHEKARTRELASLFALPVHDKAESQDICFVEGGDYRDVVRELRPGADDPGAIVTSDGRPLGGHDGILSYTVGQRRRLPANAGGDGPWYVTRIDPATNTIVVGREDELAAFGLEADEVNLIRPLPARVLAMPRYRARMASAAASLENGRLLLRFDEPQRALTPGQLVALFAEDGEEVVGAATIVRAI
ncbi:MAG TPA: tRNA 2-thiouridine(34) synthase MnmA [Candidatus Dormibacteraeota bacterium]|nr:tRNA 2-thiouridine(34) synthase MnmA [Candidatus Dormibacteraeota bacterium]